MLLSVPAGAVPGYPAEVAWRAHAGGLAGKRLSVTTSLAALRVRAGRS